MSIINISIAMATFNGEKYLKPQLDSIIQQIDDGDEIIICDDGSTDGTISIIQEYEKMDSRIKLICNSHKGFVLNFEDAIRKCNNDLILLSDQDDIWHEKKVELIRSTFQQGNKMVILHNAICLYDDDRQELLIQKKRRGVMINIIKSNYWGCCMAFKKEYINYILPFPYGLVTHDQWIGLVAESQKEIQFIDEVLITHRIHGNNVTRKLPLVKKISFRMNLLSRLIKNKFNQTGDRV